MKKKTEYIGLRLDPIIKKDAQRQADRQRVKLSHWIREVIIEKIEREIVKVRQ